MKAYWPNMINIFGTGRNVGKTTFACRLIQHLSTETDVCALKISPHFHHTENTNGIVYKDSNIIISIEEISDNNKDTSRMLKAGAVNVFFMQCKDDFLGQAIEIIQDKISKYNPIVCESAAIQNIIKPGYSIKISSAEHTKIKNDKYFSDLHIEFDNNNFTINPEDFYFEDTLKYINS